MRQRAMSTQIKRKYIKQKVNKEYTESYISRLFLAYFLPSTLKHEKYQLLRAKYHYVSAWIDK